MPTQEDIERDIRRAIEDEEYRHPVIDPTKNVLDLVKAESKYQDAMRAASEKYQDAIREAENRRLHAEHERLEIIKTLEVKRLQDLGGAETRRVDDLEAQRVRYEARIAEDLRVNVKTTSDQLAGQLIKETGALSNQIATLTTSVANQFVTLTTSLTNQMSAQSAGINTRLADLERFRWETGGKSAVADPALSMALTEMARSISTLKEGSMRSSGREEEKTVAQDVTRKDNTLAVAIVVAIIGGLAFIASLAIGITTVVMHI
jgi:hypothetical protein